MLTSISPLGERARGHRWWATTAAYVVGSTLGGALMGLLLGLLGSEPARSRPVARRSGSAGLRRPELLGQLPHGRRQVDEDWLTRYRGGVYGLGYGLQLGLGVVTVVTSASTYAVLALALLSGSAVHGVAIGTAFGVVRALPLLGMARVRTPATLRRAAATLASAQPVLRPATTGTLLAAAAAMVVVA